MLARPCPIETRESKLGAATVEKPQLFLSFAEHSNTSVRCPIQCVRGDVHKLPGESGMASVDRAEPRLELKLSGLFISSAEYGSLG